MIGPLQTNKAKVAVDLFDAIHTLDRPSLAEKLARLAQDRGACPDLFVQVNTGAEPQKAGVLPEDADAFIAACRGIGPAGDRPDVHSARGRGQHAAFRAAARRGGAQRADGPVDGDEAAISRPRLPMAPPMCGWAARSSGPATIAGRMGNIAHPTGRSGQPDPRIGRQGKAAVMAPTGWSDKRSCIRLAPSARAQDSGRCCQCSVKLKRQRMAPVGAARRNAKRPGAGGGRIWQG